MTTGNWMVFSVLDTVELSQGGQIIGFCRCSRGPDESITGKAWLSPLGGLQLRSCHNFPQHWWAPSHRQGFAIGTAYRHLMSGWNWNICGGGRAHFARAGFEVAHDGVTWMCGTHHGGNLSGWNGVNPYPSPANDEVTRHDNIWYMLHWPVLTLETFFLEHRKMKDFKRTSADIALTPPYSNYIVAVTL